jgi:hypothetical protein
LKKDVEIKNRVDNYDMKMMREFGTQMEKDDIYIDRRQDKIIYPKPYFSSEMWKRQREETTLYI